MKTSISNNVYRPHVAADITCNSLSSITQACILHNNTHNLEIRQRRWHNEVSSSYRL